MVGNANPHAKSPRSQCCCTEYSGVNGKSPASSKLAASRYAVYCHVTISTAGKYMLETEPLAAVCATAHTHVNSSQKLITDAQHKRRQPLTSPSQSRRRPELCPPQSFPPTHPQSIIRRHCAQLQRTLSVRATRGT
jgi:hypothetical protein